MDWVLPRFAFGKAEVSAQGDAYDAAVGDDGHALVPRGEEQTVEAINYAGFEGGVGLPVGCGQMREGFDPAAGVGCIALLDLGPGEALPVAEVELRGGRGLWSEGARFGRRFESRV